MAVKHSSSGSSAMKASLVLMLLFGAVVAAHGKDLVVDNKTGKLIKFDTFDINIDVTVSVTIHTKYVKYVVYDHDNYPVYGYVEIPYYVKHCKFVYEDGYVKIIYVDGLIGGLLDFVLSLIKIKL